MIQAGKYFRYAIRCLIRGRNGLLMDSEFQLPDWDLYRMDLHRPFEQLETAEREARVVANALGALKAAGILDNTDYDVAKFLAMRQAVEQRFEIPWTAITPRVQRAIYAINAIRKPAVMVAAGVFCGYTFISNAGAAVGPGAVYAARDLVGLEIDAAEAARAERNVRRIDGTGVARIIAADAVQFCATWRDNIDLLYLDADAVDGDGKGIYMRITEKAWDKMPPGSLLLAHNSVNSVAAIGDYLAFVRDRRNCRASINLVLDSEGLEVSRK